MTHSISRYEEQGESLFICINAEHTYHEHFFTSEEKEDKAGTMERLIAELELKEEAYVAPLPRISKLEEARAIVLDKVKIKEKKNKIIADKLQVIKDAKEEPILEKEIIK